MSFTGNAVEIRRRARRPCWSFRAAKAPPPWESGAFGEFGCGKPLSTPALAEPTSVACGVALRIRFHRFAAGSKKPAGVGDAGLRPPSSIARTGNLRAVQPLLGHTKIDSTVRYLGIAVDHALAIAEQLDV